MVGEGSRPRRKGGNPLLNEPPDEYLGSLHQAGKGVRVHEKASEILLRKDSKPTPLHEAMLRVFFPKSPIRLVTTNFDKHFSTAAENLGISDLPTFTAPALPLGNDFDGPVYLHGACWKRPDKIVLTDGDFGRAYLTEAWASRFLYQMFLHYTVLFVGYSHNDVVMKYIAKGLPTNLGRRRFILTEKNDREWAPFAIQPLYYDLREGDNPHSALTEAIGEWVVETHRGLHEKAEKIRSILESVPPLFGSKEDQYLRDAVKDPETAKFFRKHSKKAEYLQWAKNHEVLKPLFSAEPVDVDEAAGQIVEWYIYQCIPSHHDEALRVFQQLGPALNPAVCRNIAHALLYSKDPGFKPVSSRWIIILLNQAPATVRFEQWELLLHSCSWPDDCDIALLLLERCFAPSLSLKESHDFFASFDDRETKTTLGYDVNISEVHAHWLEKAWDRLFKPNISKISHQVQAIVTNSFEKASVLLRIGKRNEPYHDPLGFRRRSIRSRDFFYGAHVLDVLIDAALDLMDFHIENHSQATDGLLSAWENSSSPILTRIASLGIAHHKLMSADEKIQWLGEKSLSFLILAQAEIRQLLQMAYPSATFGTKQNFLDRLLREFSAVENESREQFELFELLESIVEIDPEGTAANRAFAEMQEKYPRLKPQRPGSEESFHVRSRTMGEAIDFS
ncbi:MAG TPA: SIR2 family protein, partial [Terrimicrobiaceae bacterium]